MAKDKGKKKAKDKKPDERAAPVSANTHEELAQEHLDGWKRALADYENLKRDTEVSRAEFAKYATQGLIEELLPTLDYFDAAMASKPDLEDKALENWAMGVSHVQKLLLDVLVARGLEVVEPNGMFDPNQHEAAEEQSSDEPEGTILQTLARGYKLNDKLIRPARVIISKGNE